MLKILTRKYSFNFIKPTSKVGPTKNEHSLLPYLYLYGFNEDNVGYILMEPQTKSLLAFDTGEFEKSSKIVEELENRHKAKLTHIFSTHKHDDHIGGNL
jgi:glyoxylase-like metal-dependent hydrolase (beta-lactamase superfamily II)